jgi:hypothetical protein
VTAAALAPAPAVERARCCADGAAAKWAVQVPEGPRNPAAELLFCDHCMRLHVKALEARGYAVDRLLNVPSELGTFRPDPVL